MCEETLAETASCVLWESIRWLLIVPSFKDLSNDDQRILIDQNWSMIFLLTSAEMKKFLDFQFDFRPFQNLLKNIVEHSIDSTEFMLLKLIVVFHATNVDLHDRFRIEKYRKDALFMLTEYTRYAKYRRLAELLMLVSHCQESMNKIDLSNVFFQYLINRISMSNLLEKILEQLR